MNVEKVYPVEELKSKFTLPVKLNFYGMKEIETIAKIEPECLFEIGANAWVHFIESGAKVNPQKLSEHFGSHSPLLFFQVEKVIRRKALQNILLVHAEVVDPSLERPQPR